MLVVHGLETGGHDVVVLDLQLVAVQVLAMLEIENQVHSSFVCLHQKNESGQLEDLEQAAVLADWKKECLVNSKILKYHYGKYALV